MGPLALLCLAARTPLDASGRADPPRATRGQGMDTRESDRGPSRRLPPGGRRGLGAERPLREGRHHVPSSDRANLVGRAYGRALGAGTARRPHLQPLPPAPDFGPKIPGRRRPRALHSFGRSSSRAPAGRTRLDRSGPVPSGGVQYGASSKLGRRTFRNVAGGVADGAPSSLVGCGVRRLRLGRRKARAGRTRSALRRGLRAPPQRSPGRLGERRDRGARRPSPPLRGPACALRPGSTRSRALRPGRGLHGPPRGRRIFRLRPDRGHVRALARHRLVRAHGRGRGGRDHDRARPYGGARRPG